MAYASPSDVANYCRNLLGPEPDFSDATSPTRTAINNWLSAGCALIDGQLASRGYSAIPTTSTAYDIARDVNALYVAWQAERSRTTTRVTNEERTRADLFKKDFNDQLKMLLTMDLSQTGVTLSRGTTSGGPYAGGISVSDKDTQEDDTDRVQPRFVRGFGRDASLPNPGSFISSDYESDEQTH